MSSATYESCVEALKHTDNVTSDIQDCRCAHRPTKCEYVGNDAFFACTTTGTTTERVYGSTNGKHGKMTR